jgi:hypothetical protein
VTRDYPNVRARVRLTRAAPGVPRRESFVDVWLKGTRFRVRDEWGRDVATILEDLSEPRGLGKPARTMEDFIDASAQAAHPGAAGPTDLYGDLATNQGWVSSHGQPPWPMPAAELAPAAEQILAGALDPQLEKGEESDCLGRRCITYRGAIDGEHPSRVTRVVSPPWLIVSDVRDATSVNHFYTREVILLEEDGVTDDDLVPD